MVPPGGAGTTSKGDESAVAVAGRVLDATYELVMNVASGQLDTVDHIAAIPPARDKTLGLNGNRRLFLQFEAHICECSHTPPCKP